MTTNLDADQKQALRQALEEERSRLEHSVSQLASAIKSLHEDQVDEGDSVGPSADVATAVYDEEVDVALARRAANQLREVEAALARLDTARFGVCEKCGQLINPDRLAARPWVRLCLPCAS